MKIWDWEVDTTTDALVVEYTYTPSEPRTYDYPGSGAYVQIQTITYKGVNVLDLLNGLASDDLHDLESKILEFENDGGGYDPTDYMD